MRLLRALLLLGPALASATTYPVGPSRQYPSPCALVAAVTLGPGDVVEVDPGTYHDACQLTASGSAAAPIVLRGLPGTRPVFDATGLDLSGSGSVPRAIFQFTGGSYWLVQHLELSHASNASLNGAAFRATAGSHDIVIEDVSVHDCQDGFMSDGVATVTVRASDIFRNGAGDGYSHNFYLQGSSTVLIGNHIHDSVGGQNVKIRSHDALLAYNRIENGGNYEIDLIQAPPATSQPNANVALIGNVIVRPASSDNNSQVILWGTDNASEAARNGTLYAVNNTFVMQNGSNRLFHAIQPAGSQIVFQNNIVAATVSGTGLATDATTSAILVGANNWLQANVITAGTLASTLVGTTPGFVGGADYHLAAGAQAINAGLPNLTYVDGAGVTQSAVPTSEFSPPAGVTPRASDGQVDLGAYERVTGGTPPDAGVDAGTQPDAGPPDGGAPDAGGPGGGTPGPGGGPPSPGAPPGTTAVQGGCAVEPSASPWALLLAAALLGAWRLRARRR